MIYKKENIDMSVVTSPYEEQSGYIAIEDEYTNNVLKLSGYSDIDEHGYSDLCDKRVFVDKLQSYAIKSPKYSYWYARDVLDDRFELGEPVIATDAEYSYRYARVVLKGRFELGEPVIATDAEYSYRYSYNVLEGRFELGEQAIATNANYSFWYALEVIGGRFELGESIIATNRNYKRRYEERFGVKL